ncbi:MAG: flagellar filament capping protein FliD [Vicinamibacterales bacterium]
MGSPITFSGFNSIDFNMILNAVMQQERIPLTALETRKSTLETQSSTFGTLLTKITALETAAKELGEVDSLASLSASSSDEGVGVSTTSGTVEGAYDVVVTQLARAQVTQSINSYSSMDEAIATGGVLAITAANEAAVNIPVSSSMTLRELAQAINDEAASPVSASVVQSAPGSYRLVLTGKTTGEDHAFTVESALFDAGTAGNVQTARNAALTVNNLQIVSATNTVEDVIPGVTLTLNKEAATATIGVKRDTTDVAKNIETFTTAYNDLLTFFKDQGTAAVAGKPNIGRDPILRSLRDSLRTVMLGDYAEGGSMPQLASAGVEFDATGKLKLDKKKLEAALKASATDVQKLFSGADGNGGAFGALKSLVADYTKSGGIVATVRQSLGEQATNLSKRLDTLEAQLLVRRNSLQQQYIAADMAMTQMKAQSSSLSAIGAQYRLF